MLNKKFNKLSAKVAQKKLDEIIARQHKIDTQYCHLDVLRFLIEKKTEKADSGIQEAHKLVNDIDSLEQIIFDSGLLPHHVKKMTRNSHTRSVFLGLSLSKLVAAGIWGIAEPVSFGIYVVSSATGMVAARRNAVKNGKVLSLVKYILQINQQRKAFALDYLENLKRHKSTPAALPEKQKPRLRLSNKRKGPKDI